MENEAEARSFVFLSYEDDSSDHEASTAMVGAIAIEDKCFNKSGERCGNCDRAIIRDCFTLDAYLPRLTRACRWEVYCPLPEFVAKELENVPRLSERYWFWAGRGTLETSRKKWTESLVALFKDAKVKDGHAHRFRDTFAVELLLNGTSIETMQAFLGHASVRVAERHTHLGCARGGNEPKQM